MVQARAAAAKAAAAEAAAKSAAEAAAKIAAEAEAPAPATAARAAVAAAAAAETGEVGLHCHPSPSLALDFVPTRSISIWSVDQRELFKHDSTQRRSQLHQQLRFGWRRRRERGRRWGLPTCSLHVAPSAPSSLARPFFP